MQKNILTDAKPRFILRENSGCRSRKEKTMMDPKMLSQQMIDLYKTTFDNSFNAVMLLQEQMERLGGLYWGQMINLPQETKKGLNEWTRSYNKHCADFKKVVEDGFKTLESFSA
jgi:hypothetical protein